MTDQPSDPLSPDKIREERTYALGTAAYLWGFTMNELYRVRSHALAEPGAAVNTLAHSRALLTPEAARKGGVVRSNSATLYSTAWLDLSVEPMVLEFPAGPDRYFTFDYIDYYQRPISSRRHQLPRAHGTHEHRERHQRVQGSHVRQASGMAERLIRRPDAFALIVPTLPHNRVWLRRLAVHTCGHMPAKRADALADRLAR